MKIRICDLSEYVEPGGDATKYLSLPGKNTATFSGEILDRARVGRPFTDVPDYIRQTMLSEKFKALKPLDCLVYVEITLRAARHYVLTGIINGMRVKIKPGQFYTSVARMVKICPFYTAKKMRGCLKRLVNVGFIRQRDLKMKRGRIITLVGWADEEGQSEWPTNEWTHGPRRFPFPPSISGSTAHRKLEDRSPQVGQ
ncbi:MAG: hypothetical protein IIA60_09700 [Candidatus Marinimicrobia bacterium]|nr:hypothetical protein [Candidatus Neomarinimicrobiota bacterium]